MEIIDYIAGLCARANSDYRFLHEEAEMINVKIDGFTRGTKFVYAEAVRTGAYIKSRFGVKSKSVNIRLFFCQFTGFGNDMRSSVIPGGRVSSHWRKIEQVLKDIENEIVIKFVDLLDEPEVVRKLSLGQSWTRIPFQYPPSRYDGNEVSVMLEFTVTEPIC
jgi:hypothetical protein